MRVRVFTNGEARIKAGLEPVTGVEWVDIDLSKLTQAQRDELAATGQDGSDRSGNTINLSCAVATQETVAAKLQLMADQHQKDDAEKAKQVEHWVQRFLAMSQEEFNSSWVSTYPGEELTAYNDPRLSEKKAARESYRRAQAAAKQLAAEDAERKHQEYKERLEAQVEAEKEQRQAELKAWAAEHGSERLKLAIAGGYDCTKTYLEERTLLELGEGWTVDTRGRAEYEERANPSLAALKTVEELPKGFTGQVVWLTRPPYRDEDGTFEACEAVLLQAPYTSKDLYLIAF